MVPTPPYWLCECSTSGGPGHHPMEGKLNCMSDSSKTCVHHRWKGHRQPPHICSLQHPNSVCEHKTGLGLVLGSKGQCILCSPLGNLRCVSGSVILHLTIEECLGGRPFSGLCLLRLPNACVSKTPIYPSQECAQGPS